MKTSSYFELNKSNNTELNDDNQNLTDDYKKLFFEDAKVADALYELNKSNINELNNLIRLVCQNSARDNRVKLISFLLENINQFYKAADSNIEYNKYRVTIISDVKNLINNCIQSEMSFGLEFNKYATLVFKLYIIQLDILNGSFYSAIKAYDELLNDSILASLKERYFLSSKSSIYVPLYAISYNILQIIKIYDCAYNSKNKIIEKIRKFCIKIIKLMKQNLDKDDTIYYYCNNWSEKNKYRNALENNIQNSDKINSFYILQSQTFNNIHKAYSETRYCNMPELLKNFSFTVDDTEYSYKSDKIELYNIDSKTNVWIIQNISQRLIELRGLY